MPERLNICCLFDKPPSDWRSAFIKMFEAAPSWMGQPSSFMILDVDTEGTIEGTWPPSNAIIRQPLERQILFIYSKWKTAAHRYRSDISLMGTDKRAVYTLSFPVSVLRQSTISDVECRLVRIYETVGLIERCTMLIGPELELQATQSARDAIALAFGPTSLAAWAIVPDEYVPDDVGPFEVVTKAKDAVLLWHPGRVRDGFDFLGDQKMDQKMGQDGSVENSQ